MKPSNAKTPRYSNFELLRILLIIMVLCHHAILYSGLMDYPDGLFPKNTALMIYPCGQLAVAVFMLISGYFLSSLEFKLKRIVRLILRTILYSFGIFIIFQFLGSSPFSWSNAKQFLLPISYSHYWFITTYVFVVAVSPLLNNIISQCPKRTITIYLIVTPFILQILPFIVDRATYFTERLWFVFLYIVGGYLRKDELPLFKKKWSCLLIFAVFYSLIIFFSLQASFLPAENPNRVYMTFVSRLQSFPLYMCSLGLFIFFKKMPTFHNKVINLLGGTTLAVYAIHEHKLIREVLWTKWISITDFAFSPYLALYILAFCIIIFLICAVIDILLDLTLGKIGDLIVDPLCAKIQSWAAGTNT